MSSLFILVRTPVTVRDFARLVGVLCGWAGCSGLSYTRVDLSSGESMRLTRLEPRSIDLGESMVCARSPELTVCATNAPLAAVTGNVYVYVDGVALRPAAEMVAGHLDWWLVAGAYDEDYGTHPLLSMMDARYAGYRDQDALLWHLVSTLVVERGVDPEDVAEEAARRVAEAGLAYPWWGDPRSLYAMLRLAG